MFIVLFVLLYSFAVFLKYMICMFSIDASSCANCTLIGWYTFVFANTVNSYRLHVHFSFIIHTCIYFRFPDSLGWVSTSVHKTQSLCGRQNHGTLFPRKVHYVGFSDDEVEHGGKQKRDRSRCLKIMAPSFWFINLSFVGAYFFTYPLTLTEIVSWRILAFRSYSWLFLSIWVVGGQQRALHITFCIFGYS